jgi:hypothetical protein
MKMDFELPVASVMIKFDGDVFHRAIFPLGLTIDPRMPNLAEPVIDALSRQFMANSASCVEQLAPRRIVAGGKLDALILAPN